MTSIRLQKSIKSEAKTIFRFLTEQNLLMKWFAPQAIASPLQGSIAAFAFGSEVNFKVKISELTEFRKLKWKCVDGNVDWLNSNFVFSIKQIDKGKCQLYFQQSNIKNETKLEQWKSSWKSYLDILKEECETIKEFNT